MSDWNKALESLTSRFWKYVNKAGPDGCWLWTGSKGSTGYGQISFNRRPIKAHRASWLVHYGELPIANVLHRCDTPLCVNPFHLFLGTQQTNLLDMRLKERGSTPPLHCGERCHLAKLTQEQVLAIRIAKGTRKEIAREYGITVNNVASIQLRQTWKHLA